MDFTIDFIDDILGNIKSKEINKPLEHFNKLVSDAENMIKEKNNPLQQFHNLVVCLEENNIVSYPLKDLGVEVIFNLKNGTPIKNLISDNDYQFEYARNISF